MACGCVQGGLPRCVQGGLPAAVSRVCLAVAGTALWLKEDRGLRRTERIGERGGEGGRRLRGAGVAWQGGRGPCPTPGNPCG